MAYLWLHVRDRVLTSTADDIVSSQQLTEQTERSQLKGILGGAGTYAVIGARLFTPGDVAKQVGWVVHAGHDFPLHIREEIDSWGVSTRYIDTPHRCTTRALNTYSGDFRGFEFLTPKIQVDHTMLDEQLLGAKVFHIIGTPERCISLVQGIMSKRAEIATLRVCRRPMFVWEPMENSCSLENMALFQEAMKLIDTFSPNEDEFAKLFGIELQQDEELSPAFLEANSQTLLTDCGFEALVIRLGAKGALVVEQNEAKIKYRLLPAYHQPSEDNQIPTKLVDVTGGGNTFLGGYCIALAKKQRVHDFTTHQGAAIFGSVAASFAIEQIGMPKITKSDDIVELWNGERVQERLHTYTQRIGSII